MSTLNVNRVVDASGGVLAPISSVMRNRIINGAMVIAQRGTSAVADGFMVDRFQAFENTAGVFSWQQVSEAPAGFNFSAKCTVTTANASPSSSDVANFQHIIEGLNVADLGWGTANAKTVTLSFWIRSSLTGNFGASILNSGVNRSYPFLYSISAANTWEYKTVTIAGDTSGTWLTDNGIGLRIMFNIGGRSTVLGTANTWGSSRFDGATGSTNILATLSATWQVTGVQLEVGTQATSFEYRQYQQELALCQRYYYRCGANTNFITIGIGQASGSNAGYFSLPMSMRASPTSTFSAVTINDATVNNTIASVAIVGSTTNTGFLINYTGSSSNLTTGKAVQIYGTGTTSFVDFSAEL